jgi:homocysteine S-methyltransferase
MVDGYTDSVTLRDALLARQILIGDGANGTLLQAKGFSERPYDLANLLAPQLVADIHAEYFAAGADFVETNTYQANRLRLPEGTDVTAVNIRGAELARSVAPAGKYVLGAIGPAGKVVAPIGTVAEADFISAITEQAAALHHGGVDGFFLETFEHIHELKLAIAAVQSVSDRPILASKIFVEDGEALSEGLPIRFARELAELDIAAIGANCAVGPQRMLDIVRMMAEATDLPILAFPTPGLPQLVKGLITYDAKPVYFAQAAARLVAEGASVVGGCCGTTPEHIAALRQAVDAGIARQTRTRATVKSPKVPVEIPESEPSRLAQRLGKEFTVTVEMDVPRGMNLTKLIDGVREMQKVGVDNINISDGARARLRMNPTAVSAILQRETGVEVTMHVACRDRNLLALQADLLGARALGVQNILAVTGDPANIGDYPSATSVFDIDSIGLCRILSRFNQGIDLAGNSVGQKCGFTIAAAFNPLAVDLDAEMDRLRRKADAGAQVLFTQPLFSVQEADLAAELTGRLGLPVFLGVLPLRHARHAEFMNNEVPGISIPPDLLQQMARAESDADALEIGVNAGQTLSAHVKKIAAGLYLMPPVNGHQIARRVLEAVSSAA